MDRQVWHSEKQGDRQLHTGLLTSFYICRFQEAKSISRSLISNKDLSPGTVHVIKSWGHNRTKRPEPKMRLQWQSNVLPFVSVFRRVFQD